MQKISFLLLLCAAFLANLQAQPLSPEIEKDLVLILKKDNVDAFKKAVEKNNINLQTAIGGEPQQTIIEFAITHNAFLVACYIFEHTKQDADQLIDEGGLLHLVSCYRYDNKAAFEFLALLLKNTKTLQKDPELYLSVMCRFDMGENGYKNCKITILALKEIGVDINGELLENPYDESNKTKTNFLIEVCKYPEIDDFALWLIEQGADPHKKVAGKSAYEQASDQFKAAVDKQAKKAAPQPQEPEKGKKKKKAKKKAKK
jgi:hypothetical protein